MGEILVYSGANGLWFWRLAAANGRIVCDSAEGYDSEHNCLRGLASVRDLMGGAQITIVEGDNRRSVTPEGDEIKPEKPKGKAKGNKKD